MIIDCQALKFWGRVMALVASLLATSMALAQASLYPSPPSMPAVDRKASGWLLKMHEAPRHHNYMGTLVVTSGAVMASSRVWHVCDGDQILERVESLNGVPRVTFRRDQNVITFLPKTKRAYTEIRDSIGLLNSRVSVTDATVDQYYSAQFLGLDRLAGLETEVVLLAPRDQYRFAYKIWADKKTGLIVKMETLNEQGFTLEQVGYTEMRLSPAITPRHVANLMAQTQGYTVQSLEVKKTSAQALGWSISKDVPGFKSMSTYLRPAEAGLQTQTVQWIFSDGLASVSVFIDPFDPRLHKQTGLMITGATHTWVKRLKMQKEDWVITVVGEVPVATLQLFTQSLARAVP
jgi:sigma-E factor negative regulatory protein RseB